MAYSGDPSSSETDEVRFLIGDTDTSNEILTDAEIDYTINDKGSVSAAAVACAEAIAAQYAKKADKSVGDLKISYSKLYDTYIKLANRLKQKASLKLGKPYAGGISIEDKESVEEDTDRVQPRFERDKFSYKQTDKTDPEWADN
mgnify:CR=1 FL=1